jgi:hypothetical protein
MSHGQICAFMAGIFNKIKTNSPKRVDQFFDSINAFTLFQLMMLSIFFIPKLFDF